MLIMLWSLIIFASYICRSYGFVSGLPVQVLFGGDLAKFRRDTPLVPRTRSTARFATVYAPPKTSNSSPDGARKPESLPWDQSINPIRDLTYMPMFKDQLEKLASLNMKKVSIDERFTARQSGVKPARIGSMCFQNEKFRKVRMTYFDGGDAVQVLTSFFARYSYVLHKPSCLLNYTQI